MGGFGFLSGVLALFGAGASSVAEDIKVNQTRNFEEESGINWREQIRYENDMGRIGSILDYQKVEELVRYTYPDMSDLNVHKTVKCAMVKRIYEEETDYKYGFKGAAEHFRSDELDRFTPKECGLPKWYEHSKLIFTEEQKSKLQNADRERRKQEYEEIQRKENSLRI